MKKFFGWFMIVAGIGNFIGLANPNGDPGAVIYGIGFIGLGIYLISSSKKKEEENLPNKTEE
ncbi:MAG: hypothetical protein R2828_35870 [Saprospiraceae bacterium]